MNRFYNSTTSFCVFFLSIFCISLFAQPITIKVNSPYLDFDQEIYGPDSINMAGASIDLYAKQSLPDIQIPISANWSVDDTTIAVIDETGILTAKSNGVVKVTAINKSDPSFSDSRDFKITNQNPVVQFRVMTNNVRNINNPSDTERLNQLADQAILEQADLLFMTAMGIRSFTEGIADALGNYDHSWVINDYSCFSEGRARGLTSKFKIVETNKYQLPATLLLESKIEYAPDQYMYAYNVHLPWVKPAGSKYPGEMETWFHVMEEQGKWRDFPTIITGTFNTNQYSPTVALIENMGFNRAGGLNRTFNHIFVNEAFTFLDWTHNTTLTSGAYGDFGEATTVQLNIEDYQGDYIGIEKNNDGSSFNFSASDFENAYRGNQSLTKVKIINLPEKGQLLLNGNPVVAEQEIDLSQIGDLSFEPEAGATGWTKFYWSGYDGNYGYYSPITINFPSVFVNATFAAWGSYQDMHQLKLGNKPYLSYPDAKITQLPEYLDKENALMLRGPQEAIIYSHSENHRGDLWGVKVDQPVTAYVALSYYDVEASKQYNSWYTEFFHPGWLNAEFELVEKDALTIDDDGVKKKFHIFKKEFPSGKIDFGVSAVPPANDNLINTPEIIPILIPRQLDDIKLQVKRDSNLVFNKELFSSIDFSNELASIGFTNLPTDGQLSLNDEPLNTGQQISLTDLSLLHFKAGKKSKYDELRFIGYNNNGGVIDSATCTIITYNFVKDVVTTLTSKFDVTKYDPDDAVTNSVSDMFQEFQPQMPEFLRNSEIFRFNNRIMGMDRRPDRFQFTMDEDADVYILHDSRIEKPDWLINNFTKTNDTWRMDDWLDFDVYKHTALKGEQLVLGENFRPDYDRFTEDCFAHYWVFAAQEFIPNQVKFQVDASREPNLDPKGLYIAGEFNEWTPEPMQAEGNNIYSFTQIYTGSGQTVQYKFLNGENGWETIEGESSCAMGEHLNRFFVVPDQSIDLPVVCLNSCAECEPSNTFTINDQLVQFSIQPNPVSDHLRVSLQSELDVNGRIEIYDLLGNRLLSNPKKLQSGQTISIDGSEFSAGIYLMTFVSKDGDVIVTERVVVSR